MLNRDDGSVAEKSPNPGSWEAARPVGGFWKRLCKRLKPVAQKALVLRD